MKKTITRIVPLALSGLLCAGACQADSWDDYRLGQECEQIAKSLNQLVNYQPSIEPCAGDVSIAAAYIESAGLLVGRGKYTPGLSAIMSGEMELKAIASSRPYCAAFAPLVKPYLARVIVLEGQIEGARNLKHD